MSNKRKHNVPMMEQITEILAKLDKDLRLV